MIIPDFSLHKQLLPGLSLAIGEQENSQTIFLNFSNF